MLISGIVTEPSLAPTSIQFNNYPSGGILENLPIGSKIADLKSVDASVDDPGSFSIVGGSAYCKVSGTQLQVSNILSYEDGATRSCNVRVTDKDGAIFDKFKIITVVNVNEAPIGLSVSTNNMDEEQSDTKITMTPNDPDNVGALSIGQTFSFNLLKDGGYFKLDRSNPGVLLVRRKANYEALSSKKLSLQVQVTDSGIPGVGKRGQQKVLEKANFDITVNDVNEPPHSVRLVHRTGTRGWVKKDTEATIHEWCSVVAKSGTPQCCSNKLCPTIATLTTSDPESTQQHTFTMTDDSGGHFALSSGCSTAGSSSCQIVAVKDLDYEKKDTHFVFVTATDNGDPAQTSTAQKFTITVRNVAEPPGITPVTCRVAEKETNNAVICQIIDGGAGTQYEIVQSEQTPLTRHAGMFYSTVVVFSVFLFQRFSADFLFFLRSRLVFCNTNFCYRGMYW